jgi:hypothetical protein
MNNVSDYYELIDEDSSWGRGLFLDGCLFYLATRD